jgi:hypothetical protein
MKIAILVQGGTILSVRADSEASAIDLEIVDADFEPDDAKSRWAVAEQELPYEIPT